MSEYKNLTQSELIEADHYAETGNGSGLAKMKRISAEREGKVAQINKARFVVPPYPYPQQSRGE